MSRIKEVFARQILDSRGNPTVEAVMVTANSCVRASVPSGASTGSHEALELRDGGKAWHGVGVTKAVKNVSVIGKHIRGMEVIDQEGVDRAMISLDGTKNKSRLGANAMLAVSLAVCRAAAADEGVQLYKHVASLAGTKRLVLPVPFCNIINGGKHAGNKLDVQEYMVVPSGAKSFAEAVNIVSEIYHELKRIIQEKYGRVAVNVGDEGGFAPPLTCVEEPFDLVLDAVKDLGYWKKVRLGMDVAASSFYRDGRYFLEGVELTSEELLQRYLDIIDGYPLVSLEDPFFEEDWKHFALLTKKSRIQIVGDDLLVTNPQRVQKGIVMGSANCLLLKVNQIGTVSEALEAASLAMKHGWRVMVSHRSGETEDSFISDLAVGLGCGQIKIGAPCRGERTVKYNQLLRIEEECRAKYAKFF